MHITAIITTATTTSTTTITTATTTTTINNYRNKHKYLCIRLSFLPNFPHKLPVGPTALCQQILSLPLALLSPAILLYRLLTLFSVSFILFPQPSQDEAYPPSCVEIKKNFKRWCKEKILLDYCFYCFCFFHHFIYRLMPSLTQSWCLIGWTTRPRWRCSTRWKCWWGKVSSWSILDVTSVSNGCQIRGT